MLCSEYYGKQLTSDDLFVLRLGPGRVPLLNLPPFVLGLYRGRWRCELKGSQAGALLSLSQVDGSERGCELEGRHCLLCLLAGGERACQEPPS